MQSRFGLCVLCCGVAFCAPAGDATDPTNRPPTVAADTLNVLVTARKWFEPLQRVPGAVTVQDGEALQQAGVQNLRDAASSVPNLTLGDFSVRRLTFPYLRGIGSGRNSPAVTTCIDGVPQLSYATANQEFLSVDRVEFLRGAQGALYGQNALGGTINIVPLLPTRDAAGSLTLAGGDYNARESRFSVNGPVGPETASASLAGGYASRDGYTQNRRTGDSPDGREALFGFAQLYWPGQQQWSFRLSLGGERDRDGDYVLKDLGSVRSRPDQVCHDYDGRSDRDLVQPVLTAERKGDWADFTSISAFQGWWSHDLTDLDMLPISLMRRDNEEMQQAWIEEMRLSSPSDTPVRLGDRLALRWLTGLFAFTSDYSQRAFNDYRPLGALLFSLPMPYRQHDDADLSNRGASLFGQSTFTLDERLELGVGLRADLEQRSADTRSYTRPTIQPPAQTDGEQTFRHLSPQFTLAYHFTDHMLAYVEAAKGFKSGGFNAQSPAGQESYDEESSWTFETGLKTAWMEDRLVANLAVFRTLWDDIQLDVPSGLPNLYYIDNAGRATSRGAELELQARLLKGLTLFGSIGLLDTEFAQGSSSGGTDIGDNDLPFAPHATWHAGAEYTRTLHGRMRGFVRGEVVGTGGYAYDPIAGASQGSYTLANIRTGVDSGDWRFEFWVRNLCDRDYVPLAFPYPLSLSGYVGEPGTPRTLGASITRRF
jgi:iron complex outermembrane receptor protein